MCGSRMNASAQVVLNSNVLRLMSVAAFMTLFAHWNSCFQYLLATFEAKVVFINMNRTQTYDFHPDSWVSMMIAEGSIQPDLSNIYVWCFYGAWMQVRDSPFPHAREHARIHITCACMVHTGPQSSSRRVPSRADARNRRRSEGAKAGDGDVGDPNLDPLRCGHLRRLPRLAHHSARRVRPLR